MRFIPFPSRKERFRGYFTSLHFAPDNRTLAAVERINSEGVYLSWWDLHKQSEIILDFKDSDVACGVEEDAGYAPDPVLSLDHRFIAYVYIDRGPEPSFRLVDRKAANRSPKNQKRLTALKRVNRTVMEEYHALQFSPDGRFLVAAVGEVREYMEEYQAYEEEEEELEEDSRGGIYRWNVEAILRNQGRKSDRHLLPAAQAKIFPMPQLPQPLALQEEGFRGYSFSMIFSPDGSKLAAALWNDRVLCWEFPSGRPLPELRIKNPGNAYPFRLAFSPDSKMLAVATEIVTLYKTPSMTPTITISPNKARTRKIPRISSIAYHPTEHLLATVSNDSFVRFFDGETGAEKETFDWKIGKVSAVAFSQDGCLCGVAGEKGLAIWDVSA